MQDNTPLLHDENRRYEFPLEALIRRAAPLRRRTEEEAMAMAAEPTHLDTFQMMDYLEHKMSRQEVQTLQEHLHQCDFCLSELVDFARYMLPEARPAWTPTAAFLQRVTQAMTSLIEPLFPRGLAFHHAPSDATPEPIRQPLLFDDPHVLGSFSCQEAQCELRIEHPSWAAGSLIFLEVVTQEEEPRFGQFYVFKEGWERSAIETIIEGVDFTSGVLRLRKVDTAQLGAEEAEPLQTAFRTAVEIDPEALEAWRHWADSALAVSQTPAIRELAEQIKE